MSLCQALRKDNKDENRYPHYNFWNKFGESETYIERSYFKYWPQHYPKHPPFIMHKPPHKSFLYTFEPFANQNS